MQISNTRRDLFQLCPRKYYYVTKLKLTPREPRIALEFGEAVHLGLGKLYDTKNIEEALKVALAKWGPFEGMDMGKGLRNKNKLEEMLRAYHKVFFGKEYWEDKGGEKLLAFPLVNDIEYIGKIDRFGLLAGNPAIQEWKHSASPGFFVAEPNNQLTGYCWLASMATDSLVRKVLVTIGNLYKSSREGLVPPRVKSDPPKWIFLRDPITIEDFLIEEWKLDIINVAAKIQLCETKGYWEKNAPQGCGSFGGCEFKPLCLCSAEEKPYLIEMQYTQKEIREE